MVMSTLTLWVWIYYKLLIITMFSFYCWWHINLFLMILNWAFFCFLRILIIFFLHYHLILRMVWKHIKIIPWNKFIPILCFILIFYFLNFFNDTLLLLFFIFIRMIGIGLIPFIVFFYYLMLNWSCYSVQ